MAEQVTFYQKLIDSGYPADKIYHHESDLYVEVTPETTALLSEWLSESGYGNLANNKFLIRKFRDAITGRLSYDVAFQYEPYWVEKFMQEQTLHGKTVQDD